LDAAYDIVGAVPKSTVANTNTMLVFAKVLSFYSLVRYLTASPLSLPHPLAKPCHQTTSQQAYANGNASLFDHDHSDGYSDDNQYDIEITLIN